MTGICFFYIKLKYNTLANMQGFLVPFEINSKDKEAITVNSE